MGGAALLCLGVIMDRRFARLAVIWALALLTVWVGYHTVYLPMTVQEPRLVMPRGDLADSERAAVELFNQISPSVAAIFTEYDGNGIGARVGTGSGFVWDGYGHIVTNNHVVEGATQIAVRLDSDKLLPAELVGTAPDYDLAVLRLPAPPSGLQPIAIGSSHDLAVGQTAFAIGNPFGLNRTLTQGIVSAVDRTLPTGANRLEVRGVIQTDAAVNPGNSGGPLLDSAGRLIGVNTAIVSGSGSNAGIGFAVPVDVVNRVIPQLIRDGRMPRHGIGITVWAENASARLEVPGVIVASVVEDSPAERAGLRGVDMRLGRLGDVITHVNGNRVRTVPELATELAEIDIGERALITVLRDGAEVTVEVTVTDIEG